MRLLWLYLFVHVVCAQAGFGRSYLGNSRLCHTWDCLNKKLNLTDALPPRDQYSNAIRQLLPDAWHDVLDRALDTCYGNRTKKYTNTCPGQALLHCTLDQMIENCPLESWVKADGCAPLSSIAAFAYMFSQSRYINLEENLLIERRPTWFLKNYFNTKCCNVPQLFSDATLQECGFSKFMFYHIHEAQRSSGLGFVPRTRTLPFDTPFGKVGIRKPHPYPPTSTSKPKLEENPEKEVIQVLNPLECCNMEEFIHPQWRSQCGFDMRWDSTNRLSIVNSPVHTTTTAAPVETKKRNDVRFAPLPCEKQNCIYRKLDVITESGEVDINAFTRLLDNLTNHQPEWAKAKARVVTKCLTKPMIAYDGDCHINQILGCTADVLSENCPNAPKNDTCRHGGEVKDGITCLISSSKYRPKNRRQFCSLPNIVSKDLLSQCNASWTWTLDYIPSATPKPTYLSKKWSTTSNCKELTESTICLMMKMGVLNKYGFLDYFKTKDKIREFTHEEWSRYNVYSSAFQSVPFYREYCSSPKKFLNVIDSMLLTCPLSKRSNTNECTKMFNELASISHYNLTEERRPKIMKHFQNVFLPDSNPVKAHTENLRKANLKTNTLYDFGIFNNEDVPPVKLLDLRPKEKILVILPVYQRPNKFPINQVNNDGIFRG